MQSLGTKKRKSDQLDMSSENQYSADMTSQQVAPIGGNTHPQESPSKRQRVGITLAQKQALIDNLQLEITERARKLRANYNIHAQSLRTRVEIRVNRIPLALRKLTMGELLEKYSKEPQQKPSALVGSVRGPPVPAKDVPSRPPTRGTATSAYPVKRRSHEISGGDKENEVQTPQKKIRPHTIAADTTRNPAQVLSPAPSNSRFAARTAATPNRSGIARPAVTPGRAVVATNVLNKMVDGSRSTTRPATATGTRKTLTSSTGPGSSSSAATAAAAAAAAARRKRGATVSHHPNSNNPPSSASRPTATSSRTARRASGTSESSEGSTSTVIRKRPMTAPPGAQPKPPPATLQQKSSGAANKRTTVMGTIKKGVAGGGGGGRKVPAGKAAAAAETGTGNARVLRKRA
ncbi:Borealin N terminal-domain-containing protein [Corynascus similis CBS 632.67]